MIDAVKFTKSFPQAYWWTREPAGLLMFQASKHAQFKFSVILRNMPISNIWDAKRIILFLLICLISDIKKEYKNTSMNYRFQD